ncbi:hypothetical protein NE857_13630 [Nocardiopsis exhalans]|uniref:DUF6879 domain-containing protein n=1 Tax=Nocardiopsis exhalans TaxID=163604 RepID=A0ABY5DHB1_9ACTN|nr:DUF6879 family protein [Nocardiopsis exhalans]USY22557.1 hypothetical protein NE857_13630 [Nocardiopsis exhalans]
MTSPQASARPVSEAEFDQFFEDCRYTAFRLETLQVYDVSYEEEAFRRFLTDGEVITTSSHQEWARIVGGRRRFHRVHVVVEPLTDYLRFECVWAYRTNVKAGEDVNVLPVSEGSWPAGIPRSDYWLFDSEHLVRMNYASDGTMLTPELVTAPDEIVRANVVRDRALHLATPFTEYERHFDTDMRPL